MNSGNTELKKSGHFSPLRLIETVSAALNILPS